MEVLFLVNFFVSPPKLKTHGKSLVDCILYATAIVRPWGYTIMGGALVPDCHSTDVPTWLGYRSNWPFGVNSTVRF